MAKRGLEKERRKCSNTNIVYFKLYEGKKKTKFYPQYLLQKPFVFTNPKYG